MTATFTEAPDSGRAPLGRAALVAVLVLLAYVPALRSGFIWDDDAYVTENLTLRSWDGLRRIWLEPRSIPQYYPLVHTTFWIEHRLWGLAPYGYHTVNVLIHVLGAALAWRLLRRLAVPGAGLAAAAFALHPVHVESVAWITERKNVLSLLCYLGAMLAYLRFEGLTPGSAAGGGRLRAYALALVAYLGALASKTVTCSFPAAVLVILWWKRGRIRAANVWPLLPFLVAGVVAGLNTARLEVTHVGAIGAAWDLSLVERSLIAGRALWFYAAKLAWPHPLIFIYPRWEIDAGDALQFAFPVLAAALVAALWLLRHRTGRGPLAAVLLFGGTLFPALGFVNVYPMLYSFVADHFQYHASLALIALGAAAWVRFGARLLPGRLGGIAAGAAVLLLGAATWRQTWMYRDAETLWRRTLEQNPGAWMAHNNLGGILAGRGEFELAAERYRETLRLHPGDAQVLCNLGKALADQGRADEAERTFREAIEIAPLYPDAHFSLAIFLAQEGRSAEALESYRETVRLSPRHPRAQNHMGILETGLGRPDAAIRRFEEILVWRPEDAAVQNNLAVALAASGRAGEALGHLREALRWGPSPEAHVNLGLVLERSGDRAQAAQHYRRALELRPGWPRASRLLERDPAAGGDAGGFLPIW